MSLAPRSTAVSGRNSPSLSRTGTPNPNDALKRKKPAPPLAPVASTWSQPSDTGVGREVFTQLQFLIDYLRSKEGQAFTANDLIGFLNVFEPETVRKLRVVIKGHSKIEYDPNGLGGKGSYMFKPAFGVRSADGLLAFLQSQTTAQGIRVTALKDGWSGALDTIESLEKEGKLLVTQNKKDNSPKMAWPNDPTLIHEVDNDFKNLWHDVQAPGTAEALRSELLAFGLTPTSAVKNVVAGPDARKKKKVPRSGGRRTNTHMDHILKNYDHLRRG